MAPIRSWIDEAVVDEQAGELLGVTDLVAGVHQVVVAVARRPACRRFGSVPPQESPQPRSLIVK